MIKVINTPVYNDFFNLVQSSEKNIKLCSPFIKNEIVDEIYKTKKDNCEVAVVTNVNLMSMYKRSSDIGALRLILKNGGLVYNYQKLHAKIYIFDDKKAIITSANLTGSGLKTNFEYGVLINETSLVNVICEDYSKLCNSELSGRLKTEHTDQIQSIIDSVSESPQLSLPKLQLNYDESTDDYFDKDIFHIIKNLNGWKRSVFYALGFIENKLFSTADFPLMLHWEICVLLAPYA
jgi:phosphatidylserine/phosphatidylglycerophosphate/cardiolipin synthase-like enzyme